MRRRPSGRCAIPPARRSSKTISTEDRGGPGAPGQQSQPPQPARQPQLPPRLAAALDLLTRTAAAPGGGTGTGPFAGLEAPRRLIDVGCDHARLALAALEGGLVCCAVASDLRPGPLAAARREARRRQIAVGEGGPLELRLADGLQDFDLGPGDAIAILGLGGREILNILEAADWPREGAWRVVVQPMQQAATLRLGLWRLGFRRILERVVLSGGRDYQLWLLEGRAPRLEPAPGDSQAGQDETPGLFEAIIGPWGREGSSRDPDQDPKALIHYLKRQRRLWTARLGQELCTDESGLVLDRAAIRALLAELEAVLSEWEARI
ncbi:MAG: tRNA (adenine(22)-N(1))-methyltransferase TrmK [Bacillota bacterium]|nr:tRNA (adenine(22)-N(1))-methyltransferase TrmK [Bacillota bacterium]